MILIDFDDFTGDARRQQFDSYNRLFGEPARNPAPARNKTVSSIPIGSDAPDSSLKQSNGNVNGRELNGHEKSNYHILNLQNIFPS